ncbi:MAG: hypothetical protein PHQ27_04730 [Victivallales bacterium]|nr:hypothetical protein [Victivallales bacterium]
MMVFSGDIAGFFIIFAGYIGIISMGGKGRYDPLMVVGIGAIVFLVLLLAGSAKRQYVYWFGYAFVLQIILIWWVLKRLTLKWWIILSIGSTIAVIGVGMTRIASHDVEKKAVRETSLHALYYSILMHTGQKVELVRQLSLPEESVKCIWYAYGAPPEIQKIFQKINVTPWDVCRAIYLDPVAFIKLNRENMKYLGNFYCPLGMIQNQQRWIEMTARGR